MLTRDEADMVVKEAIAQGWADEETTEFYPGMDKGRVDLHDFGETPDAGGNSGCAVELLFPGMYSTSKYWITSTDDWRKLKAKVDEMKEIVKQAAERGWLRKPRPSKVGKLGMMVEVVPPATPSYMPKKIGNMANWRKLCREYDEMITIASEEKRLPS